MRHRNSPPSISPKKPKGSLGSRVVKEPLYAQVAGVIRSDLLHGRSPGDRLTPEVELAKQFGVSVITIRQALSELVREGLLERRRGSGTYIASAKPATRHVAILLDVDIASGDVSPYFLKLIRQLRRTLAEVGLSNRIYLGKRPLNEEPTETISCPELFEDLELDRLQGVIGFLVKTKDHAWSRPFKARGIPTLDTADIGTPHETARRMMETALTRFKQLGRQKIALIGWRNPWIRRNPFPDVFFEVADQLGLKVDSRLVDFGAEGWVPGMGWERFRDIWLSGLQKPDGLLLLDDMLYRDCEMAIESLGIEVPRQLEIIVRSSDAMALNPQIPISEMKFGVHATAELFAESMKSLINGGGIPKRSIPWTFEVSGTPELLLFKQP